MPGLLSSCICKNLIVSLTSLYNITLGNVRRKKKCHYTCNGIRYLLFVLILFSNGPVPTSNHVLLCSSDPVPIHNPCAAQPSDRSLLHRHHFLASIRLLPKHTRYAPLRALLLQQPLAVLLHIPLFVH